MTIDPIEGERLRFFVSSETVKGRRYLVDLEETGSDMACECDDDRFRRIQKDPDRRSCKHVRFVIRKSRIVIAIRHDGAMLGPFPSFSKAGASVESFEYGLATVCVDAKELAFRAIEDWVRVFRSCGEEVRIPKRIGNSEWVLLKLRIKGLGYPKGSIDG